MQEKDNKTLKLAKGYRGARSKQYRVAKQSVMRALKLLHMPEEKNVNVNTNSFWIARINAAGKNEWNVLQHIYAWPEAGRC